VKRQMIISLTAFAIALAPLGLQPQANEAHHPDKSGKTKKSPRAKPKQTKKPPTKTEKSSERETRPDARTVTA